MHVEPGELLSVLQERSKARLTILGCMHSVGQWGRPSIKKGTKNSSKYSLQSEDLAKLRRFISRLILQSELCWATRW